MAKRIRSFLVAACLCLALSACGQGERAGLQPGTYTGTGTGHGGPIEVQLVIDGAGRIADLQILSESETPGYAAGALELLPRSIVKKQSLGLDAVAGATLSSNGVLAAAAEAIAKAGGDPKDYGFVSLEEQAREIAITGLPGGELRVTNARLRGDYEITERDAVSVNSKGEERNVHAKGVLLETILQKHGASLRDFGSATATASDGYSITIPGTVLHNRDILIAFETDGEAIAPRFVVPGERAMYWVKLVSAIALEAAPGEMPVTEEIDLGELIERLRDQAVDYRYKEAACKALPVALLLREIGAEETAFVTIQSTDGLTKTEQYDTFAAQALVFEGTPDAPLYTGASLPEGMWVKNVASFQVGGVLVKAD